LHISSNKYIYGILAGENMQEAIILFQLFHKKQPCGLNTLWQPQALFGMNFFMDISGSGIQGRKSCS